MKKKVFSALVTMVLITLLASTLFACKSGVYYPVKADGSLDKDSAITAVVAGDILYYRNNSSKDYKVEVVALLKDGKDVAEQEIDGRKYKVKQYSVEVREAKVGKYKVTFDKDFNVTSVKEGNKDLTGAEKLAVTAAVGFVATTFKAPLFYDQTSGVVIVSGRPLAKRAQK